MNGEIDIRIDSIDLAGLDRLAAALLERLPVPMVIGLTGTLGAGKTTLVQAIARAAQIDTADVTSPTFTLLQTHRGRMTLHHLDAYRVADDDEFLELGIEELLDDVSSWTIIEWADRVAMSLPPQTLWIEMTVSDNPELRSIHIRSSDPALVDTGLDTLQRIIAD